MSGRLSPCLHMMMFRLIAAQSCAKVEQESRGRCQRDMRSRKAQGLEPSLDQETPLDMTRGGKPSKLRQAAEACYDEAFVSMSDLWGLDRLKSLLIFEML